MSSDGKDEVCGVCNRGGLLLVCDACVQAYHHGCVGLDAASAPDESERWTCRDAGRRCTRRREPQLPDEEAGSASEARWEGPSVARRGGDREYAACAFRSFTLNVGDAVEAESGGAEPFVGTVERLWEDAYGEKWVELRWFYRPEETAHGRLRRHLPNEVFHSAHLDTNPLACVLGKVRVVSEAEFRVLQRESDFDPSGVYVCRMRYNDDTGEFRPLLADRGRQVSMDSVLRPSLAATTGMAAATGAAAGAAETDTRRGRKGGGRGGDGDEGGGDGDAADAEDAEEMTVYRAASLKLQLSAAPARLPCREKEHATIKSFLAQAIRRGGFTGGLYISGMPGTGKTATVRQVVRELGADAAMPPFQFVEINGMKLPSPQFAYSLIWQAFRGKHEAPAKALALLDQRFGAADSRRACCVLLVDELDYLLTRKQDVLYNLFDWTSRKHARLVVVCIANTLDLPDRLMPRVHSRLGLTRLAFAPYTREQLHRIITDRLAGLAAFDGDAVELCARKVASVSGDVRRALHICRLAAELCELEQTRKRARDDHAGEATSERKRRRTGKAAADEKERADGEGEGEGEGVQISHIQRAIEQLYSNNYVTWLRGAAAQEKVFLAALLSEMQAMEVEEAPFLRVCSKHERLSRVHKLPAPSQWELQAISSKLAEVGVLSLEWRPADRHPAVRLLAQPDDVEFALQDDELWAALRSR